MVIARHLSPPIHLRPFGILILAPVYSYPLVQPEIAEVVLDLWVGLGLRTASSLDVQVDYYFSGLGQAFRYLLVR